MFYGVTWEDNSKLRCHIVEQPKKEKKVPSIVELDNSPIQGKVLVVHCDTYKLPPKFTSCLLKLSFSVIHDIILSSLTEGAERINSKTAGEVLNDLHCPFRCFMKVLLFTSYYSTLPFSEKSLT